MKPTMITLMAYEDLAVASHAKEKWKSVCDALKDDCASEPRLWKCASLSHPELSAVAVRDVVNAEIIMVATSGAAEPPFEVTAWIEQWLAGSAAKAEITGLVVFLCFPSDEAGGAFAFSQVAHLQRGARRGSMDSLATTSTALSTPLEERMTNAVLPVAFEVAVTAAVETVPIRHYEVRSHYGLNE